MAIFNVHIKAVKEYLHFTSEQGEEVKMQGVRVILGPKLEKFFMLENLSTGSSSNLDLLAYTNPNLVQWYMNSPVGAILDLKEFEENRVKIPVKDSITDIYTNAENEL